MVIPGMGVDPARMAEMQRVSQHINCVIRVDYATKTVTLSMSSAVPEAAALIPELMGRFSEILAQQLSGFFAIKGELVEVGKPK